MAKVGKTFRQIAGKNNHFDIIYNPELKRFIVLLTDEVYFPALTEHTHEKNLSRMGQVHYIEGLTEKELTDNLDEYIKLYEAKERKERKVIMIRFGYDSNRWRHENSFHSDSTKVYVKESQRNDVFHSEELTIEMDVKIAIEKTIGKRLEYIDEQEKKTIADVEWQIKNWTIVEYSDERKAFLEKLYGILADQIDIMKKSFLDENTFQELVSGKIKLLK